MTTISGKRSSSPRLRRSAILDATLDVLQESGYELLTIEAVASRAAASRATVYRHWPTKVDLVSAALRHGMPVVVEVPDTGSFRSDLRALLIRYLQQDAGRKARLVAGLVHVALNDEALRSVLHQHVLDLDDTAGLQPLVNRAIARGELSRGTDTKLLVEVTAGCIYLHTLVMANTMTVEDVDRLINRILLPLAGK